MLLKFWIKFYGNIALLTSILKIVGYDLCLLYAFAKKSFSR